MRLRSNAYDWNGHADVGLCSGGGSWMELHDGTGSGGLTIYFEAEHFTDPMACADEIAAVIAKHRRADKPAEAV